MKITEGKHNHNLTTILKSCLFGLVMILPFLAILPSTLYFAFNEHAQNYTHEEVIETYEYETNEVNSVDDLVVGNIYHFEVNNYTLVNEWYVSFYDIYNIDINIETTDINTQYIGIPLFRSTNDLKFMVQYQKVTNNGSTYYYGIGTATAPTILNFKCDFVYRNNYNINNVIQYISASDYLGEKNVEVVSSEQSPLNAFNTASNNVWNSPIFNWVNDGLGSIAIANMLTVFGIARNTFISNILIYWLSITAIYIIIDIVISAFTILTHLITKKAE